MIMQRDLFGILNAIKGVPKECIECVAFHQEGHISVPCRGDFNPHKCEDSIKPSKDYNNFPQSKCKDGEQDK